MHLGELTLFEISVFLPVEKREATNKQTKTNKTHFGYLDLIKNNPW